jgi:hypothetical protein
VAQAGNGLEAASRSRSTELVSSRYPAPDEFDGNGLPDLPGDLLEDEDLYAPRSRRLSRAHRPHSEEWEEERPDRREHPRRRAHRQEEEVTRERRPRRRPERRGDDDMDMAARREPEVDFPPAARPPVRRRREEPRRPQPARPSRHDHIVEPPRMKAQSATADMVTSIRPVAAPAPRRSRRSRNPAWTWKPIVMPQPRQMLSQAFPNLLMALTAIGILFVMPYIPFGLPLWAPLLLAPILLLYYRSDKNIHPMWGRAAVINLMTVGAFFPLVIVRQSVLRVSFVEWGNGTLLMPVLTTLGVVLVLAAIALASAFLSEEDPEYAGIIFLPAALLVPFFAGATEITNLVTAFTVVASIYVAASVLTVIASMLPGAFPTLVAPIALALEFLILPLAENTPIFPVGAGMSAKLLFFVMLFVAVGLTIAVPMLAVWVRQVRRLVEAGARRPLAA